MHLRPCLENFISRNVCPLLDSLGLQGMSSVASTLDAWKLQMSLAIMKKHLCKLTHHPFYDESCLQDSLQGNINGSLGLKSGSICSKLSLHFCLIFHYQKLASWHQIGLTTRVAFGTREGLSMISAICTKISVLSVKISQPEGVCPCPLVQTVLQSCVDKLPSVALYGATKPQLLCKSRSPVAISCRYRASAGQQRR